MAADSSSRPDPPRLWVVGAGPAARSTAPVSDLLPDRNGRYRPDPATPDPLSDRERDVLALIAQGCSNHEIAGELFLSINTIKTYIRSAYRKIGVTRRTQAVIWARTMALHEPHPGHDTGLS